MTTEKRVISDSDGEDTAAGIPENTGLVSFYTGMTGSERKTFWACALGWGLDGLDFQIYPLVIGTLIALWQVDPGLAGLAGTATLLASAVGGWLAGFVSDRIGRVRTLQLTVLWFSLFSLLCAFAQNFNQLLVTRALLGLGFGGEWAAGAILMGETIRAQSRGRAVGAVQSGWAVGWGVAVLMQAVLFSYFPAQEAWRYMFALGALPALLIFYIRSSVEEPKVSQQARALEKAKGDSPPIWEIFKPQIVSTTLLAALMSTGAQGGYHAITFWLPRFLTTERQLSIAGSSSYLAALITGSFVGYLTGAWLADRIGRRKLFLLFSLGAIAVVLTYTQVPLSNEVLWFLGFPLGFFSSGYFSGMGPFLTELFPTRIRGSGQGFCYNFGRGLSATFLTLIGLLTRYTTLGNAIAVFAIASYTLFFVCAFILPETRGKVLRADE